MLAWFQAHEGFGVSQADELGGFGFARFIEKDLAAFGNCGSQRRTFEIGFQFLNLREGNGVVAVEGEDFIPGSFSVFGLTQRGVGEGQAIERFDILGFVF